MSADATIHVSPYGNLYQPAPRDVETTCPLPLTSIIQQHQSIMPKWKSAFLDFLCQYNDQWDPSATEEDKKIFIEKVVIKLKAYARKEGQQKMLPEALEKVRSTCNLYFYIITHPHPPQALTSYYVSTEAPGLKKSKKGKGKAKEEGKPGYFKKEYQERDVVKALFKDRILVETKRLADLHKAASKDAFLYHQTVTTNIANALSTEEVDKVADFVEQWNTGTVINPEAKAL